jgi:hypothetical protein
MLFCTYDLNTPFAANKILSLHREQKETASQNLATIAANRFFWN